MMAVVLAMFNHIIILIMTTILLLAAGALSFAVFYKTVHFFEKI